VPSELRTDTVSIILNCPNLKAWYTQNYDGFSHPKLAPFPIGLDLHTPRETGGPKTLVDLIRSLRNRRPPIEGQPLRAFCDLNLSLCCRERYEAVTALLSCSHVDFINKRVSQKSIWERYAYYPFVLSTSGNGLDCHRTYEALYLGSIVIMKHSPLDPGARVAKFGENLLARTIFSSVRGS